MSLWVSLRVCYKIWIVLSLKLQEAYTRKVWVYNPCLVYNLNFSSYKAIIITETNNSPTLPSGTVSCKLVILCILGEGVDDTKGGAGGTKLVAGTPTPLNSP